MSKTKTPSECPLCHKPFDRHTNGRIKPCDCTTTKTRPDLYKVHKDGKETAQWCGDEKSVEAYLNRNTHQLQRFTVYSADDETLSEPMDSAEWLAEVTRLNAEVAETPQLLQPKKRVVEAKDLCMWQDADDEGGQWHVCRTIPGTNRTETLGTFAKETYAEIFFEALTSL
jgi:hypothetical protein